MPDEDEPTEVWHPVPAGWIRVAPEPPRRLRWNLWGRLDEVRTGRVPFDARKPAHWLAGGIAGFVILILVWELVDQSLAALQGAGPTGGGGGSLWILLGFNLVFLVTPAVVWVVIMYEGGWRALATRLLLRSDHLFLDVLIGVGLGVAGILVSFVVSLLYAAAGGSTDNPLVEDLSKELTWGLVFFIPFVAAVSEEIFFRGFLQMRIGVIPGSVAFGFVHLSYQTPLQVIVPLLLGLVLTAGMLGRRSLVPALVGHFMFNFIVLALLKVVPTGDPVGALWSLL